MPRPCRQFSSREISEVRRLQKAGKPRGEIAKMLGITSCSFAWHMKCGRFGVLPRNPGRRAGSDTPLKRPDIPEKGVLFGCPKNEWQERRNRIRDSWDSDEAARRAEQRLPNTPDLYSKFKHSPFRDEKPKDHRQSPKNW